MDGLDARVEEDLLRAVVDVRCRDEPPIPAESLDAGHVERRVRIDEPALAVVREIVGEQGDASFVVLEEQQLVARLREAER